MADTPIKDYEKLDTESKATIAANARAQGITPQEYLTSRGGVYKSGYYGDTPEFRRLSDEAYATAQGKGSDAINTALFNQIKQSYQDNPNLIEDPYLRLAYQNKAITIDQLMQGLYPDTFGKKGFGTPLKGPTPEPIGALADGTPIYGFGSDGKPVTDPSGKIYSTTSSSDAITKFNSGANPIGFGSSTTSTATATDAGKAERQSAYDLLFQQFDAYGLGALVTPLKGLIESGVSPAEFTIKLRETDAYKKRFAANSARINKGLRALSEAEYIGLEDQYQDVMRRYGLPQEYYARGDMGRQEGFEKFIGGDVSPVELEDRVQTAQRRVLNAAPQVKAALTQFYGAEIGNGDILAYVLDPDKAIENIKRKVTAAEIGGGALRAGLGVARARAEELGQYGVTGEQAITGFGTIASGLERGRQLSQIYNQPDYTQAIAEAEVFALPDAEKARRQRRKIGQLETAEFGGTTGMTSGALGRERAGQY